MSAVTASSVVAARAARRPVRTIAAWEFRSSVRSRWVLVTAVVFGVLCLGVTLLAFRNVRAFGLAGIGPASATLVNLGVLLPSLMGLVLGAGGLAAGREQGWFALLAAQPIRRSSLVVGTFLGLTASLWTTLGLAYGAAAIVLSGVARPEDLPTIGALVGSTFGVAAAAVAIGIAVSSVASSRTQAVAAAVGVWVVAALGLDLALAAIVPALQLGPGGLLAAILMNPLEAGRVLALLGADLRGSALGPFGAYLVATYGAAGAIAILALDLGVWVVVPIQIARAAVRRRDV